MSRKRRKKWRKDVLKLLRFIRTEGSMEMVVMSLLAAKQAEVRIRTAKTAANTGASRSS
jgi:hypothetical protein